MSRGIIVVPLFILIALSILFNILVSHFFAG